MSHGEAHCRVFLQRPLFAHWGIKYWQAQLVTSHHSLWAKVWMKQSNLRVEYIRLVSGSLLRWVTFNLQIRIDTKDSYEPVERKRHEWHFFLRVVLPLGMQFYMGKGAPKTTGGQNLNQHLVCKWMRNTIVSSRAARLWVSSIPNRNSDSIQHDESTHARYQAQKLRDLSSKE